MTSITQENLDDHIKSARMGQASLVPQVRVRLLDANLGNCTKRQVGTHGPYTRAKCTPNHFFRSHQVCSRVKPLSRRMDSIMSSVYL